jgi:hypothetical protein
MATLKKRISNKKKIDMIVTAVCAYFILFVIVSWITYWIKGDLPESLIQYGLGGGTLELVLSAAIEIFSNRRSNNNE